MFRVAIQIKELISSNVTSAIEAASNPAKMLTMLQREIEESIISLTGERTRVTQAKRRAEASLTQQELKEADWADKAKTAMEHGREDLARQALLAREECRQAIAQLNADIKGADANLAEIDAAVRELEAKREETRLQAKAQMAADYAASGGSTVGGGGSRAEAHLNRIATLEQRAQFAIEDEIPARTSASVDREIDEMRRASAIEAELAALRATSAPAKKAGGKKG
ncbi:PspA/IM30 family protein [Porphyrobacter sp. YT40]|uniref:PspA/IM30 family protein n=1 Tax=Porphyrobacter sp. YT40 TaxID=2547601 RepID=UPI0015E8ABC6|nr:PspA/IM30 family protein [Porphyrobacter sp. YT40]